MSDVYQIHLTQRNSFCFWLLTSNARQFYISTKNPKTLVSFQPTLLCSKARPKQCKQRWPYLEVSHHNETCRTDPASGEASGVQHTVLVLLNHMSVTQKHNHHHCEREGNIYEIKKKTNTYT